MRRVRLTGGRAVLCADRMDGGLEDPGRDHDGEPRRARARLDRCENGRARVRDGLQRPSVCPLRRGASSLRGLCGVSMYSGGRQPVQTVVAPGL
jgi:hypothetical protein